MSNKWFRNSTELKKIIIISIFVSIIIAASYSIKIREEVPPVLPPGPTPVPIQSPIPAPSPTVPVSANIQKIGHLGNGNSFDLIEMDGYLYVGQGTEIRVYNVSSESKIAQLDWRTYTTKIDTEYLVRALDIDSKYLYVVNINRLTILDISNPSVPSVVSYIEPPIPRSTELRDIKIKGNYAFLSASDTGVLVIDISDKKNPALVTTIKLDGYNRPWRLDISDNYLYAAMQTDNRLDIIDITDPKNPAIKGSWSANAGTNSFSGVAVKGKYAYVTEYHNGVHVIDISDPAKPAEVTSLMDMNANDIKILGDYAYVSVRYQGFNIINISNPSNISITGEGTGISGYIEGIFPTSKNTYLAAESKGFDIYDTSDVTKPELIVKVPVVGGSDSVAVKGNYMYIGAHNDGVWVADISDPAKPEEVAFTNLNGRNEDVYIEGNSWYVAGDWTALNILDIGVPTSPAPVLTHYGTDIDRILVDGNYVYTSIYPAYSMGIIDITNRSNPIEVSQLLTNGKTLSFVKYDDNHLLAAARLGTNRGLHIIDVSDKKNPVLLNTFDSGIAYKDVAVNGNVAVALADNSIVTLNMSDPANPVLLDKLSYPETWSGDSIDIYNNTAYAAGGPNGTVRAFDINDPSNIKLIDTFDLPENALDIRYSSGKLFVADDKSGIYILSAIQAQR